MSQLRYARSFRDLVEYQKAREVAKTVFELTKSFPREELYSLTDQIRRSSRSIGGQIAEAWAKRNYARHFISKCTDADREQLETQHWVDSALDCRYLRKDQADELNKALEEVGKMLNSMIHKADEFCTAPGFLLRDSVSEYFINPSGDHLPLKTED